MLRSIHLLSALAATALAAPAFGVVLYDGSLGTTLPTQGWQYGFLPLAGNQATVSQVGSATRLDTTAARGDRAGFFSENPLFSFLAHPSMPTLDRAAGYTVRFDLHLLSETHNADDRNGDNVDDRAGFSVIAISSDLAGIELGFWEDEVWAYSFSQPNPGTDVFFQGEGAAFDTTAGFARYDLAVEGSGYRLYVDGTLRLTGSLRTYTPNNVTPNVYGLDSFLFLGDDTTSADAAADLAWIEVLPFAVPEPVTSAMLLLPFLGATLGRRRPRKATATA